MRILVLCPYVPYPPTHGGRIRSGVVLRALTEVGDVEVVAPVGAEDRGACEELRRATGAAVFALPAVTGAEAGRHAPFRKLRHWGRARSDVVWRRWIGAAVRAARARVREQAPDLLVVDTTFATPLAPRPGTISGRRLFNLHNIESEVVARLGRGDVVARVESRLIRRLEVREATRADLAVTVSGRDRDSLARAAPAARIEVVENSVDLARISLLPVSRVAGGAPRLLFVGSFDYPPNREAANEILQQHAPALRAAWPNARIRLVGRDASGEITVRAAAVDGVEYVGFVTDLAAEYAAATAVFVPLRSGGGTRIKVLEAFAYGRPVIATAMAVEGLGLVEGESFLGCETPAAGVASVRRVLAGDAGRLVARGRALVEARFSHDAAVERFVELLRRVV